MHPILPPPAVHNQFFSPFIISLNRAILTFMLKNPTEIIKAVSRRVAVVNMTPICSSLFCLSSNIMLMKSSVLCTYSLSFQNTITKKELYINNGKINGVLEIIENISDVKWSSMLNFQHIFMLIKDIYI